MKKIISFSLIIITMIMMVGCKKKENSYKFYFDTIPTVNSIIRIDSEKEIDTSKIESDIEKILQDSVNNYDTNNSKSTISKINKSSGVSSVLVNDEFIECLKEAIEISEATKVDGKTGYDITIFPLWKKWGFLDSSKTIKAPPKEEDILALKTKINYKDIIIDGNNVKLKNPGQEIDLGSIAKGMVAQKIMDYLKTYDLNKIIINVGGNIVVHNREDVKESITVGIRTPFSDTFDTTNRIVGYIKSKGTETYVTSGTYERYFTDEDGNMYHHILSLETGFPVDNNLVSVSVVGDISSSKADALATAILTMGLDKGYKFAEEKKYQVIFITKDKNIICTSNIKNRFVYNKDSEKGYKLIEYEEE